ncbi:MAG: class I SAM-dependent methyltransferase [Nitrospira sp.]|nr:class I SAM-dependent methyltransferase [Nitrospira sp.]
MSATISQDRLFHRCPLGCSNDLQTSAITLTEGPLLRCAMCSQLLSSCTRGQYELALRKWDTSNGTTPAVQSVARFQQVTERRLRYALRLRGRLFPPPLRLLDVGCSSGALLAVAAKLGFSPSGVEIASKAAETAQRAGFDVFCGLLHEARFADESFDVITAFELIEHLNAPRLLLNECHRILKPEGVLIINTPNAASWTASVMRECWDGFSLSSMGGHVSFFSPRSLANLAGQCGFRVERLETRRVRFAESHQVSPIMYRILKVMGEVLNIPASLLNKGHDMLAFLRKM